MKKKYYIILSAVTVVMSFACIATKATKNDLIIQNVEALATSEESGTRYNICYSETKVKKGYSCYKCGNCNEPVYDEKGIGTYSKCFY